MFKSTEEGGDSTKLSVLVKHRLLQSGGTYIMQIATGAFESAFAVNQYFSVGFLGADELLSR